MEYLLHLFTLVSLYCVLAVSLDLLMGHTGLISVAHASFFGIGAYASGLVSVHYGRPLLGVAVGIVLAMVFAMVLAIPGARERGDSFILVSFAFQVVVSALFENLTRITRGPMGVVGIPSIRVFGSSMTSPERALAIAAILAMVGWLVAARVVKSPFGRVLHAIREDEMFVKSLGKNPWRFKVEVLLLSAAMAAMAGSFYAYYVRFLSPSTFDVSESILLISMIILGGAGTRWGPVMGPTVLILVPEGLRFLGMSSSAIGHWRQMAYGLILIVMMRYRPRNIGDGLGSGRV